MARGRIERARDGTFRVRLPSEERVVLRGLVEQLRQLLGTEDPSLRRLYPPGYGDDPVRDAEYRELVRDDLERQRLHSIEVLVSTVTADRLDEEQLSGWLAAVNDLRLVLGTRIDVTEDLYDEGMDQDDPRAPTYSIYLYLGWLEEQIVAALSSALRSR